MNTPAQSCRGHRFLCIFVVSLLMSPACHLKSETPVVVFPGRSIAGVELGMSREDVIFVLGEPTDILSSEDLVGKVYESGTEALTDEPLKRTMFLYSTPYLSVVLGEDDTVELLQLSHTDHVRVKGYDFLKFKYLTKEEIEHIGKPSSVTRNRKIEQQMLSRAPKGTRIEFYHYIYDQLGLWLDLVFDRTEEQTSEHFIGLNSISVLLRRQPRR